MVPAVVTFALCLAIVLGLYWAFVVLPEDQAGRKLRKRLKPETEPRPGRITLTRRAPRMGAVKSVDAALARFGGPLDPLRRTLEESGLTVTIGVVVVASLLVAVVAFIGIQFAAGRFWLSGLCAVAAGAVPFVALRFLAQRRLHQFEDQFPQAIELIAGSLRAGHAFTTGVSMVADEVADPTGAEFRLLYDHQNYGMPLPDALKAFARRVPMLDARFFITAVLTQREAGGNLAEVLDHLSTLIRERSRIKRQVRVSSAHGRITGWVLAMMPPALAVIMVFVAPTHMRAFIDDPLGIRIVLFAVALQIIGMLAIRRIVNVEF